MAGRRTWLALVAGLSVVVLAIVARLLVTTSGHSTNQTSAAPSSAESAESPTTSPATSPAASPNISISSSAPSVSLPSNAYYFCPSKGIAICSDQGGDANPRILAIAANVDAPTLSMATRTIYFRQSVSNPPATTAVQTIQRVSLDGGASTTIATAPASSGDEGVGLGGPQVSPDGRYLAYVVTIGVVPPSSPGPSQPLVLPDPVGSQIFILNVAKRSGPAVAIPMTMTGADLPDGLFHGYTLVGWAPDDSRLYYYGGSNRDLEALSLDAVGQPIGVHTVVRGAPTETGCAGGTPTAAMTPSGDVLFTAYCHQQVLTIDRLHDGSVTVFASLPQLTGVWLTQGLIVDTTGRRVQLDALPAFTDCTSGEATITFLDGKVIDQQIETQHPGCPP